MSKFNVGDKVRYIGKPDELYGVPKYGDVGCVVSTNSKRTYCQVIWKYGSFSYIRHCDKEEIEMVIDMANEEIWKMLRSKFNKNNLEGNYVRIDRYGYIKEDVYNAIALAYRSGYERAMKGRPFKIGEKKKKGGHWEPVDPNNLPKEGTRVRYSRPYDNYVQDPSIINIGDIGWFKYNVSNRPGIKFRDDRFWNWVDFGWKVDCLDMWVEDDE